MQRTTGWTIIYQTLHIKWNKPFFFAILWTNCVCIWEFCLLKSTAKTCKNMDKIASDQPEWRQYVTAASDDAWSQRLFGSSWTQHGKPSVYSLLLKCTIYLKGILHISLWHHKGLTSFNKSPMMVNYNNQTSHPSDLDNSRLRGFWWLLGTY